ncbi:DUF6992 family protein [Algoriphagus hitonicola]|uniref:Uncharacterized protein n=1 Tax=Algoriphagus hitonicola TaxID=435880 RepID=A0A1I2TSC2_9BACT|nr:hypothetical protein [Algoriphagus hitonicola]SFG66257.1 hypothetical protein SAMN04487988_106117 [Algoriphagus hitonicola]
MDPRISFRFLFIFLFLFIAVDSFGQEISGLENFNQTRLEYNKKGMLILGSWAVGNMIWGGLAARQQSGELKAFHQMNLYWNSVNLVIAGLGYWQATKESPGTDFWQTMEAQQGIEKILLVNAALDVAYMAGGFYLKERGLRKSNERLIGFGKSVILQGAFLLVFDGIMYGFHHAHSRELPGFLEQVSLGPTGFSLRIPLN